MNDLQKQVRLAHRRLLLQRFINWLPVTLSAGLLVAMLAILAPKFWALSVQPGVWAPSWVVGGLVVGVLAAAALTYVRRMDALAAAIEVDQRFGLKERVSSCLALSEQEQMTEAGQALIQDATRRIARMDVGDRFRVSTNRWAFMPCALAITAFGLTWLADATPDDESSQASAAVAKQEKKVVANSTQKLIEKTEKLQREAVEKGLKDAGDLFKKLESGVNDLKEKQDVDRQKALVKLNDLAKQMQERKKNLLSREELRKQLNSLKDMKSGPADKLAKAMKQGDFQVALDELKKLQNSLGNNKLTEKQKQELTEQLNQLKDKLQQMADAHEQAKQDLQKQLQQKLAQGDREAANKLQQQLDQMMQQQEQMQKMGDMAQKLAQAAQAMQQGKNQQAAQQLGEMAAGLEAMQQDLAEMEMLEEALGQIDAAKSSMNCSSCQGMGCSQCNMEGMAMNGMGMDGMGEGEGMGEGQGRGDRPEEETKYGTYDSQVRAKPGKGKAITSGVAYGPNRPGQAIEEIKAAIQAAEAGRDDPLTNQRLPKPQRELTRDYFGALSE